MKEWVYGLLFSLIGGATFTWLFLKLLRLWLGTPPKPRLKRGDRGVPSWLTGVVERLFFTILVGLNVSGLPAAMMGWLALKLATNWNHPDWKEKKNARTFAFSALLAGLISMFFAFVGGQICSGTLRIPSLAVGQSAQSDKPEDVVARLYRDYGWQAYVGQYFNEIVNDQPSDILQRYFTPQLAELIMKERKFEIETKQVGPPNFDLLFGSQNPDGISNIRINRQSGSDVVTVLYDQNRKKDVIKIDFLTIKTSTGWRISDIHYQGGAAFDVWLLKVLSGPY